MLINNSSNVILKIFKNIYIRICALFWATCGANFFITIIKIN